MSLMVSQASFAINWDGLGKRFSDAGKKMQGAAEKTAKKVQEATEPHLEKVLEILAEATEDIAIVAEDAANEL